MSNEYPELEKMKKVFDKSQAIGEFIDWLYQEKEIFFGNHHKHTENCEVDGEADTFNTCGYKEDELVPIYLNIEKLLAEYFNIDLDKIEKERQKILEDLQNNG